MSKSDNLTDFLTDLADNIRAKTGQSGTIDPQNFGSTIAGIQTKNAVIPTSIVVESINDSYWGGMTKITINGIDTINHKNFYIILPYTYKSGVGLKAMSIKVTNLAVKDSGNWEEDNMIGWSSSGTSINFNSIRGGGGYTDTSYYVKTTSSLPTSSNFTPIGLPMYVIYLD